VVHLSRELAAMGIDIVTGGGPGLMEAANSGAVEGREKTKSRSFGLPIHLPTEEAANPFVDQVFKHRTFFSRLHHFVRLSSAFIVMPGGIGTALETFMIWQLLQVKHIKKHPLILVGTMWEGLVDWMEATMESRGLVSPGDIQIATVVPTADDALPIISQIYEQFKKEKQGRPHGKRK
ncbi:MAG: LOG family protein, partial [Acidobacteria bacterium]|nr:LOG family protein [Acidobacteriota bacterium]